MKTVALHLAVGWLMVHAVGIEAADGKKEEQTFSRDFALAESAVFHGDYQTVQSLAKNQRLEVLGRDKNGNTLLHIASSYCMELPECVGALMVRTILGANANVHVLNKAGRTPFEEYCLRHSSCCIRTMHALLEGNAMINEKSVENVRAKIGWGNSQYQANFLTILLKEQKKS